MARGKRPKGSHEWNQVRKDPVQGVPSISEQRAELAWKEWYVRNAGGAFSTPEPHYPKVFYAHWKTKEELEHEQGSEVPKLQGEDESG